MAPIRTIPDVAMMAGSDASFDVINLDGGAIKLRRRQAPRDASIDENARTLDTARIITMAWGERYIADLLALTIPAVVAPGNLPAFARHFRCEFVIVTERRFFSQISRTPIVAHLLKYCDLRLVPIDDLLSNRYGITLTHALVRGFADLGPAMVDAHLVFLNADFIVADGSYAKLAEEIAAGARIVVSPSYCMVLEDTVHRMLSHRDAETGALAIPRREMAALIVEHRHNTIRAKTANQRLFRMHRYDQLYWYVDEKTMLSRQMPVAVVYMRPERVLTALDTFWDYGVLSEYCPTAEPCVLGDSDEFLMGEMRQESAFAEVLHLGWPTADEIAADLSSFTTKDHRDYGRFVLKLHAADLPANVGIEEEKFRRVIDDIDHRLGPAVSYLNHPFWAKDIAAFRAASAKKREKMLAAIDAEGPLGDSSGERSRDPRTRELDRELERISRELSRIEQDAGEESRKLHSQFRSDVEAARREAEQRVASLREARDKVLEERHALIAGRPVAKPDGQTTVAIAQGPVFDSFARAERIKGRSFGFARSDWFELFGSAYRKLFGGRQRTAWHPFSAPLAHIWPRVEAAIATSQQILVVASGGRWGDLLAGRIVGSGNSATVSPRMLLGDAYGEGVVRNRKFDLVICEFAKADLLQFRELLERIAPLLTARAKVVVFHFNEALRPLDDDTYEFTRRVFPLVGESRLVLAGSLASAWAIKWWRRALMRHDAATLPGLISLALTLLICSPLARLGYRAERRRNPESLPRHCTSMAIEIDLS